MNQGEVELSQEGGQADEEAQASFQLSGGNPNCAFSAAVVSGLAHHDALPAD